MGQGGCRLLLAVAALIAAVALSSPAAASTSCSARLIADWEDGRIDRTYPVYCYRQALEALPEDLRVYSTAQSDIMRALQDRLRTTQPVAAAATGDGDGGGVSPLVVLVISGGVLAAAGSLAAIVR
jgi:hypothetical protein